MIEINVLSDTKIAATIFEADPTITFNVAPLAILTIEGIIPWDVTWQIFSGLGFVMFDHDQLAFRFEWFGAQHVGGEEVRYLMPSPIA